MTETPPSAAASLTFVGNATVLLRLGRFTILTDPNFLHRGQRAYLGKGLWSRRLEEPALQPADLPPLSAIVLSHLHGDHFDRIARKELARDVPLVTTPPAARRLSRYGFATQGLRTWERTTLTEGDETLTVESLPGIHGRGVMAALLPPVMGSLLEHRTAAGAVRRVMLSGDTLTGDHIDGIRERHPDVDVAVVHLGGTRVLLHTVTMDAEQGVDYLRRAPGERVVPVHYDDYGVFRSPLQDFLDRAAAAGLPQTITVVERGRAVDL